MTIGRASTPSPAELDRLVGEACAALGLATRRGRLLRHFANAVYLIEDAALVARVAYGHGAAERAQRGVQIAGWLTEQGFPASESAEVPLGSQPYTPATAPNVAVTFWRYYPQPTASPPSEFTELGRLARQLHGITTQPPIELPRYRPLRTIKATVEQAIVDSAGNGDDLRWLSGRIDELVEEYAALRFPLGTGLIHGDMYVGNLLWYTTGADAVLGDWDSVCIGPREIDLAPTFTATRFGMDSVKADNFADAYGHDLRDWSGYPTVRSIREVTTLTALVRLAPGDKAAASELRHRLATLRHGDRTTVWTRQ